MPHFNAAQLGLAVFSSIAITWAVAMTKETKSAPDNGIVSIDATALDRSAYQVIEDVPYMKVVGSPGAKYAAASSFTGKSSGFSVELAAYEPVTLALQSWPIDEFMYFLEGSVEISDSRGHSRTYGPGDAIVMPKGFTGTWKSSGRLRKIAVYLDPSPRS